MIFVRHDIEFRRIAWSIDAAPGPAMVLGDRVQLQQVIVNLLVNGIQAISLGDRENRRISIAIAKVEDVLIELSVRDTGPGIAGEAMGRLFESFFTTKPNGVGIGLAICQSIIRSHGGSIRADNQPGGGAHFSFTLPAIVWRGGQSGEWHRNPEIAVRRCPAVSGRRVERSPRRAPVRSVSGEHRA